MKHIALGVNIGNLSREKRAREPMLARCERINRSLAVKGVDLRITGFFRHTGNLVLSTATLDAVQAAPILSSTDGATWIAISENAMRVAVEKASQLQIPEPESDIRWTLGLAFAVTKPSSGSVTSTINVRLCSLDSGIVAAWKRDRITDRGRLDSKMREGGWGAVSGVIGDQTNSQWTARSLTSLEGILDHPTPVME